MNLPQHVGMCLAQLNIPCHFLIPLSNFLPPPLLLRLRLLLISFPQPLHPLLTHLTVLLIEDGNIVQFNQRAHLDFRRGVFLPAFLGGTVCGSEEHAGGVLRVGLLGKEERVFGCAVCGGEEGGEAGEELGRC
jgi:hypothetical protein